MKNARKKFKKTTQTTVFFRWPAEGDKPRQCTTRVPPELQAAWRKGVPSGKRSEVLLRGVGVYIADTYRKTSSEHLKTVAAYVALYGKLPAGAVFDPPPEIRLAFDVALRLRDQPRTLVISTLIEKYLEKIKERRCPDES